MEVNDNKEAIDHYVATETNRSHASSCLKK